MLIDWQLTVRNVGAYDVSYFIVQSLRTEDRIAHGEACCGGGMTGCSRPA